MTRILKNSLLVTAFVALAAPALAAEGGMTVLPPVPALPRLEPSWVPAGAPTVLGAVDLLGTENEAVLWLAPNRTGATGGQEPLGPPAAALQAEASSLQGQVGVTLRPLAGTDLSASVARMGDRTDVALSVATSSARFGMLYLYDTNPGSGAEKGLPLFILPRNGASLLASNGVAEQPLRTYGVYGDLTLGEKVGVHWAVGYAALANGERDAKKAWEYNVGIAYRVLGNLLYEAHFGYVTTDGDESSADDASAESTAVDRAATIDQVYLITNKVTMHF